MPSVDQSLDDLQIEEVENGLNRHINDADKDLFDNTETRADSKLASADDSPELEPSPKAAPEEAIHELSLIHI